MNIDKLTIDELVMLLGDIPQEKTDAIEQMVESTMLKFEEKFEQTFKRPSIRYDLEGRTAGVAHGGSNPYIRLNKQPIMNEEYWSDMLNRTIPHEVAHIVQRQLWPHSKSHGKEWAYLMHIIGLPADRTHSYKVIPKFTKSRPYEYRCDCRTTMFTLTRHRRYQEGADYYCKRCGGRFHPV